MTTVLLVDDEPAITDNLAPFLRRSGFEVTVAGDGRQALRRLEAGAVDLVVLDVLMPEVDGREVLRQVRHDRRPVPVILLTQVGESSERAMALEEGADDYLNKPFDPHELVARIRAVLRRGTAGGSAPLTSAQRLRSGDVLLDRTSGRVTRADREVVLTPRATALLGYLMSHPDELMTRERLLEAVWGWSFQTSTRTVDTRVAELRRALEVPDGRGADPDHRTGPGGERSGGDREPLITTVPGVGYRFSGSVTAA